MTTVFRWADVARHLATEPAGTRFRVARHLAEHPRDAGLRVTLDVPVGQRADFRRQRLCVQDFGTHYEARLEPVAPPASDALAHTNQVVAGAALGSAMGLLLGRTREATVVGALLAAAFTAGARNRTRR